MSSRSHEGERGRGRYPTVGPGAAAYETYGFRQDERGLVRVYERDREDEGSWVASTLAFSRRSMR